MLTLQADESSLVLAPEIGGAIVGWRLGAVPLMRLPAPDAIIAGNVRGLACFPLVPFSNRIANGRFNWEDAPYTLDRNFGDHPHTIHGVGWKRAWEVAEAGASFATLTLRHDASGDQARSLAVRLRGGAALHPGPGCPATGAERAQPAPRVSAGRARPSPAFPAARVAIAEVQRSPGVAERRRLPAVGTDAGPTCMGSFRRPTRRRRIARQQYVIFLRARFIVASCSSEKCPTRVGSAR